MSFNGFDKGFLVEFFMENEKGIISFNIDLFYSVRSIIFKTCCAYEVYFIEFMNFLLETQDRWILNA